MIIQVTEHSKDQTGGHKRYDMIYYSPTAKYTIGHNSYSSNRTKFGSKRGDINVQRNTIVIKLPQQSKDLKRGIWQGEKEIVCSKV